MNFNGTFPPIITNRGRSSGIGNSARDRRDWKLIVDSSIEAQGGSNRRITIVMVLGRFEYSIAKSGTD